MIVSNLNPKTITVLSVKEDKNSIKRIIQLKFDKEKDYYHYIEISRCAFSPDCGDTIETGYNSLKEEGVVYTLVGEYYDDVREGRKRAQVEEKIFEYIAARAVQKYVGGDAQIHMNVKFEDEISKNILMEIDSIVHKGGEKIPNSVAYIVECALSPQEADVQRLLDKMALFNKLSPTHSHYRTVSQCVPVLAGRYWQTKTLTACRNSPIPMWRVAPSGSELLVHRKFCTLARAMMKIL